MPVCKNKIISNLLCYRRTCSCRDCLTQLPAPGRPPPGETSGNSDVLADGTGMSYSAERTPPPDDRVRVAFRFNGPSFQTKVFSSEI